LVRREPFDDDPLLEVTALPDVRRDAALRREDPPLVGVDPEERLEPDDRLEPAEPFEPDDRFERVGLVAAGPAVRLARPAPLDAVLAEAPPPPLDAVLAEARPPPLAVLPALFWLVRFDDLLVVATTPPFQD
jgi:hypothetical protein